MDCIIVAELPERTRFLGNLDHLKPFLVHHPTAFTAVVVAVVRFHQIHVHQIHFLPSYFRQPYVQQLNRHLRPYQT